MPNQFIPVSYDYGSDIVVIGFYSESADITNTRGEIHGLRSYVRAVDEQGNTRMFYSSKSIHHSYGDREAEIEAKAVAERLNAKLAQRRIPDFTQWVVGRPVYGSEAYIQYGQEDDLALERE